MKKIDTFRKGFLIFTGAALLYGLPLIFTYQQSIKYEIVSIGYSLKVQESYLEGKIEEGRKYEELYNTYDQKHKKWSKIAKTLDIFH